jgi:hypothetical protein
MPSGAALAIRRLERAELARVWSIDRSERIENVYRNRHGRLVLTPERHDMTGWPPGEPEHYGPLLLECVDAGGTGEGAFEGNELVAASADEVSGGRSSSGPSTGRVCWAPQRSTSRRLPPRTR